MTLATGDGDGLPWASPVWFAVGDDRVLYWVSRPTSVHSQNIAARTDVSLVVFDTNARVGEAQAVYARARATQFRTATASRCSPARRSRRGSARGPSPT
jgi:nitroimidazol reductase NimA-like FMN-containing flavoprotein (pyridoxamine 5'-phosphate oxidase superfamily)